MSRLREAFRTKSLSDVASVLVAALVLCSLSLLLSCAPKKQEASTTTKPDSSTNHTNIPPTCDGFSFTPQTRVALSKVIESESITLSNCTLPVTVEVFGDGSPILYKNNAAVTDKVTVFTGDVVQVRLTSGTLESTTLRASLKLGTWSSPFVVTTGDFTPHSFSFPPMTNQEPSTVVQSEFITLGGFDGSLLASVEGEGSPILVVNGKVTGQTATVEAGNALAVRQQTASTENMSRHALVKIGTVSGSFDVTTKGETAVPSITSVQGPAPGRYKQGAPLDIRVLFTQPVQVTGVPQFLLDIGGTSKAAAYISGTGTTSLLFRYSIESGVNDFDGITISQISLNSGTINDAAGRAAALTFAAPDSSAVLVDTLVPRVQLLGVPADGIYGPNVNFDFMLTFNEIVRVTGEPRLALTIGASAKYATYLTGSGTTTLTFRYTTQLGASGALTMSPTIDLNGGSMFDQADNPAQLDLLVPNLAGIKVEALCPPRFVYVEAFSPYTDRPFCVAKYEMKCVGSDCPTAVSGVNAVASSLPDRLPWTGISRDESIVACRQLGLGYDLISNAQWQTLARNIEGVAVNWGGGTIGNSQGLSRGHSDNTPPTALAAGIDTDPCFGTGQTCSATNWNSQSRAFKLNNGSLIWDVAGNVWEWLVDNNTTKLGVDAYIGAVTSSNHTETAIIGGIIGTALYHFGAAGNYTTLTTTPFAGLGYGWFNYNTGTVRRGGSWSGGDKAGLYSVSLSGTPMSTGSSMGFRCVWVP